MIDKMALFQENSKKLKSTLNVSGRFSFQKDAMKQVVPDIVHKLQLRPEDTLLDIGCNCGDILIPLSFLCAHCTGIDGGGAIERLQNRTQDFENISSLKGDFLEIDIDEKYDCILIYSVLLCIDGYERKKEFIRKACDLLKSGGRMLIGDITNSSVRNRFEQSEIGKKIDAEYQEQLKHLTSEDIIQSQDNNNRIPPMDDRELCDLLYDIRTWGYESYVLPQNKNLPFGYTRQDILITKW